MAPPPENKHIPSHLWFTERRKIILIIVVVFLFLSGTTFFLCYEHYQSATGQALKEDRAAVNVFLLILVVDCREKS